MAIVQNTQNLAFTVNKNTEWIADTFTDIAGVLDGQYVYVKDTDEIWCKENGNLYEVTKNHSINTNDTILISDLRNSVIDKNRVLVIDEFKEGWFLYDPLDTTSSDNTGTVLVDASGKRFKRIFEEAVNVKWFGALGDDIQNDQPFLQTAINYGIITSKKVFIPNGTYKIDSPILLAKDLNGDLNYDFFNFELEGENKPYIVNSCPTIRATFSNTFALGIQKGKGVKISNIRLQGTNQLNFSPKQSFETIEADWSIGSCRDERYSPYSGINIDPFGMSLPVDGGYPGYTSYYVQSSTGGSTGIDLCNIDIDGFVVGFAFSVNGTTFNSDRISIENPKLYNCKSGMAFGQSQTKGISVKNIMCWGSVRFLFDGTDYGSGVGYMPHVDGGSLAGGVRSIFKFAQDWGPFYIQNLYAEYLLSLGFTTGTGNNPLNFVNCHFQLNTDRTNDIKISSCVLEANTAGFQGCSVKYYGMEYTPLNFKVQQGLSFNNCVTNTFVYNEFNDLTESYASVIYNNHRFLLLHVPDGNFNSSGYKNARDIGATDTYLSNGASMVIDAESTPIVTENSLRGLQVNFLAIETITISGNEATFTTTIPGRYRVNDILFSFSSILTDAGNNYRTILGNVKSIVGNSITIENIPYGLVSGNYEVFCIYIPRYHDATFASGTSGTTTLTSLIHSNNLENIWNVGDKIRGTGIAENTYVISRSNTTKTIEISHPLSQNITNVNIYDAEVTKVGKSTVVPTTGGWVAGDRVYNTNPTSIVMWVCATGGVFGTSLIPTFIQI